MLNRKQSSSDAQELVPKYIRGKNQHARTWERTRAGVRSRPDGVSPRLEWPKSPSTYFAAWSGSGCDQRELRELGGYLPSSFKFIQVKISKQACLHKYPLNDSRFCLFCLAQVRCDLTLIFPHASFQSGWVFHFISSKPKCSFSFCQSESSYVHSRQKRRFWI